MGDRECDPEGYAELVEFANNHPMLRAWAIEGTGGHGAGLGRHLLESSEIVVSKWGGRTWTNPSDVDIDHQIALAEAWGSGARYWTTTDCHRYANDLYYPHLNAITDNLNSSKGASDPAQWLPPLTSSRCLYAIYWVQIKYRWRLAMDSAERSKLSSILSGSCGSRTIAIPARAR